MNSLYPKFINILAVAANILFIHSNAVAIEGKTVDGTKQFAKDKKPMRIVGTHHKNNTYVNLSNDRDTYFEHMLYNTNTSGLALKGYDPVTYFEGQPEKGQKNINFTDEVTGIRYNFISEASKQKFMANPAKYEPQNGGWCSYAMCKGIKMRVDPKFYKIVDGKIYFFRSKRCRTNWERDSQKLGEDTLLSESKKQWNLIRNSLETMTYAVSKSNN